MDRFAIWWLFLVLKSFHEVEHVFGNEQYATGTLFGVLMVTRKSYLEGNIPLFYVLSNLYATNGRFRCKLSHTL